jgi:glycosyltransferase involved in cell wall biosynthesis
MRVAHFCHRYPPAVGGAESYFARLSRFIAERDSVEVWTTNALDLEAFWNPRARRLPAGAETIDDVLVRRFPLWHFPLGHRYVFKLLSLFPVTSVKTLTLPFNPISPAMYRAAGRCRDPIDLVHAGAFPYSFPLACAERLARRLRVPFLLTPFLHTGDPDDPDDRTRRAYTSPVLIGFAKRADRVFVQTEGERAELLRHGVEAGRLVLQGMGVDLEGCMGGAREKTREGWGVCPSSISFSRDPEGSAGDALPFGSRLNGVVVGHLANNSVEKGTVDLLRAAQLAWQAGQRFTVVLAGPQMPNFLAFWETFRPAGRVHVLGQLDDAQKRDFFAAIDVFALPSRSDSFGLVLPEAWANGVPCVGYRAGGLPWVIRDGIDGLVVACGDVAALAAALSRLAGDAELRRRMGEAGRARMPTFDWTARLSLVRDVYAEVLAEARPLSLP